MRQAKLRWMTWSVAMAFGGGAGTAGASAFQLLEQNASGLGNAYAGQAAVAQDASTIFFNPAGMTKLPGRNAVGTLAAVRPSIKFTDQGSTLAPLQPSRGGNGGDAGEWAAIPSGFLSWQLTPQIFVGLGVNAPFGLKTEYDPTWVGRFHAIESKLTTYNVNPSVAWKVNEMFSVGGGINYQRANATLSNAVNYSAAAFAAGGALALAAVGGPGTEGVAKVSGSDGAWGYNLGATLDLNPATRVGLSYRSEMKYTIRGSVTFTNRPALLGAALPDAPARADLKLPSSVEASLFHRLTPKVDLLADLSWTDWSTLQAIDVYRSDTGARLSTTPLNWRDTWRIALGANYHYNDAWTFRAGIAYDQTPVRDAERTPRVPDEDRKWIAIGAQYRVSKQLAVDFGYAHLFVNDASSNLCNPAQAAANPPACSGKNNLIGTYSNSVDILAVQARYAF